MPNGLAHFGAQVPLTRAVLGKCDTKWILLGCVLPDIPWILQRVLQRFAPVVDLYDLRLYCIVQASLFFTLILSFAIACFARAPWRVFLLLALNSVFHLLLDACQIKWANGVHLFAPLSWELTNFGWFWPEDVPSYALTVLGGVVVVSTFKTAVQTPIELRWPPRRWVQLGAVSFLLYIALPIAFLGASEAANNHFVRTLRDDQGRTGEYLEIHREFLSVGEGPCTIQTLTNELLFAEGALPERSGTYSIRGRFLGPDRIQLFESHKHRARLREWASIVALAAFAAAWAGSWMKGLRKPTSRRGS